MTILAVLTLAATVTQANMMALPGERPIMKTLTGKLEWTYAKAGDGTEKKYQLILKTVDNGPVTLGIADRVTPPSKVDIEKFIGKQVKVTYSTLEIRTKNSAPAIVTTSIQSIEEVRLAKP
jgi:hypothetical protein